MLLKSRAVLLTFTLLLIQGEQNAQTISAEKEDMPEVLRTTVCEIVAKPESFDGRMVEVRANVLAGLETNLLYDNSCKLGRVPARIELVVRDATRSDRPIVSPREDGEYRRFWKLTAAHKKHRHSIVPDKYTVAATFVGRLDLTSNWPHKTGFDEQFVLQSVRDVIARPFDEDAFGFKTQSKTEVETANVTDRCRKIPITLTIPSRSSRAQQSFPFRSSVCRVPHSSFLFA